MVFASVNKRGSHHEGNSEHITSRCNNSSSLGRRERGRFYCFYDLFLTVTAQTNFGERKLNNNSLKEIRESLLISKTELARNADISPHTITRIEQGKPCRMETKRKILLALGLELTDKDKVFH